MEAAPFGRSTRHSDKILISVHPLESKTLSKPQNKRKIRT
eukprot:14620.XXX_1138317_1138433_1 [CDS] Oithona nana genome sequencing.